MIKLLKEGQLVRSERNPNFTYRVVRKGVLTVDLVEVNQDDYVYTDISTKILRVV